MSVGTTVAAPAKNNFLIPDGTFIAELVAFAIILFIIGKYIVPPAQKALRERQAMIDQQAKDADAAREKLAEAEAAYKNALTEARVEAAQIRENARAEAQRTVEELRQQAQEESNRIIARGEEQLARQRTAIVRDLRAEIGTLAVELSEKIVDQRLATDADVRATVDSFIAGLQAQDTASTAAGTSGASAGAES
jgi:F-type H+-transporting ATPase subunit b